MLSRAPADQIDIASLEPLFWPDSVAIIGASSDSTKIGGIPLELLKANRFAGKVYPVNPKTAIIQGLPAFPSIRDIGQPVDLAIIAIPAASVLAALEACAATGVRAVIIFSSGFAETAAEGKRLQEAIAAVAASGALRVLGPNCIGLVNYSNGLAATFLSGFADSGTRLGTIGLVSQSGAFGGLMHRMARDRNLGLRYCITTGNEADVDVADCVAFLAQDAGTRAILVYLEGCRNGSKLIRALRLAQRNRKPVIAMKLGRTEVGAAAVQTHTAALAGSDAVYEAVFRQFGVYRAESIEEFIDIGHVSAEAIMPVDDRVGMVTVSGGVGVLMADAAAARGLDVAPLPEASQEKIRQLVPFAAARNPIDITAQVLNDFTLLDRAIDIALDEGGYASLVAFLGAMSRLPHHASRLLANFSRLRARHPQTLLVAAGLTTPDFRNELQALGCLCFEEPTHAVRALAALAAFRKSFARSDVPPPSVDPVAAELPSGPMSEFDSMRFLHAAGLPVVEERLVGTADQAVQAAQAIGFPVVLKVASADILHKTDMGGVALSLKSAEDVRDAYAAMAQRVAVRLGREVGSFIVAPMIADGIETVLGVHRDPVFGPVVMFGLGGIFIEALNDVVFRVAPIDLDEVHRMIREIRAIKVLDGVRGRGPADVEALAAALTRLSAIAAAHRDTIESIDLNPFLVRAKGRGAIALDALVVPRSDRRVG